MQISQRCTVTLKKKSSFYVMLVFNMNTHLTPQLLQFFYRNFPFIVGKCNLTRSGKHMPNAGQWLGLHLTEGHHKRNGVELLAARIDLITREPNIVFMGKESLALPQKHIKILMEDSILVQYCRARSRSVDIFVGWIVLLIVVHLKWPWIQCVS